MKELIPMTSNGLFVNTDKEVMIDSRYIAETFDKEHKTVMRDIKELLEKVSNNAEFGNGYKFVPISYKDKRNRRKPCYALNRDAFTLLVMGYNGEKALTFKMWYINRFNEMESLLQSMLELKEDYKDFVETLNRIDVDNVYRFITENNMIYKLATGMNATQLRNLFGLEKGENVRPYLTQEQNELILKIQQYDSVLMDLYDDYHIRKEFLYKKFDKK